MKKKIKDMNTNQNIEYLRQIAIRLDNIIKGSNVMLMINCVILSINIYLIILNRQNRTEQLLTTQQLHLLQLSEEVSSATHYLENIDKIVKDISQNDSLKITK